MQDDMKKSNPSSGSRSYSTSARQGAEGLEVTSSAGEMELPPPMTFRDITHEMGGDGHKFGLPEAPLARTDNFRRRYNPVVEQLTKAVMRNGKLSAAQRV
jgi:small subunit ribosomal protein S7